jgi:hypothetical protein
VTKPQKSKESIRSEKIDRILTGKWTAIPIFILIMGVIFWLTFDVIGGTLQGWLELGIDKLIELTDQGLTVLNVNDALHRLIIDGIFYRCRNRIKFPADYCYAVLLSFFT